MAKNSTEETPRAQDPFAHKKIPLPLKVFGILLILAGVAVLPVIVLVIIALVQMFTQGDFEGNSVSTTVIMFVMIALLAVLTLFLILLGIRLLRNKRRGAALTTRTLLVVLVSTLLCDMMLYGLNFNDIVYIVAFIILVAFSSYLDPALSGERELQRKLRKMEDRKEAEELGDKVGRDLSGKGYITLNFFNLFWIFVVCCVLGLVIEVIYHFIVLGHYQDRAGMLFGPFSPIYGFGALLMTLALNRFHDRSPILIFLVSAAIGGAFEFFVSWFLQFAFGITAWDYTGSWLSIDGRTNGMFMIAWGFLGLVWIKLLLPQMLKLVNLIPWNWRYSLTSFFAALMVVNGAMTLMALDFWYERLAGGTPDTPVEQFFADHFDNDFMENRFQSMSIDPENATRT